MKRLAPIWLILIGLALYLPGLVSIPVTDRDEARFAQATRQMFESGDFVRIRFQNTERNKKPVAIHWLQALSVKTASLLIPGSAEASQIGIWAYRLPSVIATLIAILLTYGAGLRWFDPRTAFLGAAILSTSFLVIVEAHLATADAALLASIVVSQTSLCRIYTSGRPPEAERRVPLAAPMLFWVALGVGIMLKGPMPIVVALLTITSLCVADREWRWIARLRFLVGLTVLAAIVAPWLIAVSIATEGRFIPEALGSDLIPKLLSGQESHGFWPGFYLVSFPVLFWPGSLLTAVAIGAAWRRGTPHTVERFCLAWIIPTWLALELIPTKLPHYILPILPPIALLTARSLLTATAGASPAARSTVARFGHVIWMLIGVSLGAGLAASGWIVDEGRPQANTLTLTLTLAIASGAVLMGISIVGYVLALRGRFVLSMVVATLGMIPVIGLYLGLVLPGIHGLALSRNVAETVGRHESSAIGEPGGSGAAAVPIYAVGYHEPSLVFELGSAIDMVRPETAIKAIISDNRRCYLIIGVGAVDQNVVATLEEAGMSVSLAGSVSGVNYTKGMRLVVRVFAIEPSVYHDL